MPERLPVSEYACAVAQAKSPSRFARKRKETQGVPFSAFRTTHMRSFEAIIRTSTRTLTIGWGESGF